MRMQEQFAQAQLDCKDLPERPGNISLLKIYGLYKQATAGDATGERPGFTDLVGRAKFDAWGGFQGVSKDDAMRKYIDFVEELKAE